MIALTLLSLIMVACAENKQGIADQTVSCVATSNDFAVKYTVTLSIDKFLSINSKIVTPNGNQDTKSLMSQDKNVKIYHYDNLNNITYSVYLENDYLVLTKNGVLQYFDYNKCDNFFILF